MKTRYRKLLIGTAIAAILGAAGAAFAHGGVYGGNWQRGCAGNAPAMGMMGGMHHGMGPGAMMGGMGSALGLSADQLAEMDRIRDEMLPLMGELRGKMQANHEQMRALLQGGTADQAEIGRLADQKGDLIAEMIKLRSQHHARMQSLLSEEQREQMQQYRQGMGMMGG